MTEVISVQFKTKGKVYYFDPNGIVAQPGQYVIVETAKGLEYAECTEGNHQVEDSSVRIPLRPVVRLATSADTARAEENHRREKEAFEICRQKIAKHGLDMKLVDVEFNFEGNKILFFFTSDGRVDFRELVKDLASVFRTRIELRQIGVRDEARMLGGLGICGKPFCCTQFLEDFQPVSIKMAKTQGLSLNPTKISGTCGRLMCCLKYEQDAYEELVKNVPKVDAFVDTPDGKGSVVDVNLLKGTARVRLDDLSELTIRTYPASEITVIGGKAKRAEYLALKAEGKLTDTPKQPPAPRESEFFERDDLLPEPDYDSQAEPRPESGRRIKRSHQKQETRRDRAQGQGQRSDRPQEQRQQRPAKPRTTAQTVDNLPQRTGAPNPKNRRPRTVGRAGGKTQSREQDTRQGNVERREAPEKNGD